MNKLAVIVPFYKRHVLTRLCFSRLALQQKKFGFSVYTAGSEGDLSKELATEFGFNYTEVANLPISNKNNVLLQSTKKGNYDGVVIVGSDDFLSDSIFELYQKIDCSGVNMYGFNNLHFYDTELRILSTNGNYTNGKITIGAGRLFTRKLIQEMDFVLWPKKASRGLDTMCSNSIPKGCEIFLDYEGHFILDVKDEMNITPRAVAWDGRTRMQPTELVTQLGELGMEIYKLGKHKPNNKNSMKIIFIRDYSPRKKGESFEPRSREEMRTAEWYLANGIAEICKCGEKGTGCADCDKKAAASKAATTAPGAPAKETTADFSTWKMPYLKLLAEKMGLTPPAVIKKDVLLSIITEAQTEENTAAVAEVLEAIKAEEAAK